MLKFFKVKEKGTTVRAELIAGLTTFMAMAYILMVNPGMFTAITNGGKDSVVSFGAMYISTAISAVIGTLLIGLLANLPLAQAPGMGLNAFFVYTVCLGLGFTYTNALVFVLADGILFVLLTVTGLRKIIFDAIPKRVKKIIPAGIGLFIAFLGFQDSGLVIKDPSTAVGLASFNVLAPDFKWGNIMPLIVTVAAVFAIGIMSKLKVKGAILWGVLGAGALYYILGYATVSGFGAQVAGSIAGASLNPLDAFKEFGTQAFGQVFKSGFDFSAYIAAHGVAGLVLSFLTTALAFCMVDMFDTMGTLYGACRSGDLLTPNDKGDLEVPNLDKAMLADAIATCTGAVCGTSTVTTYVESSAGCAAGGKTGLAAIFTAIGFFIAMFLSPVAALIPACAYSAALIYVGILMMGCVKDIQWDNPSVALPSFLTLVMMAFTYNISYGIAFGLLSHVVIKVCTGKIKELKISTWVITILFTAMFFLTH
ncbi:MAG: NCS2 family permease [Oscillospiraceae bacterium]|nr:NCS2 family permease [Candidatus Equicaccousia limihippi]